MGNSMLLMYRVCHDLCKNRYRTCQGKKSVTLFDINTITLFSILIFLKSEGGRRVSIQELLFLLVIFIANIFEAMTGFAGTLLALPPSILLIGIYDAKAVLNIFALITCSIVAILNYKYINKKELFKIFILMFFNENLSVDY